MSVVDTNDLGAIVCRALMREMDDKPIALEPYQQATEYTSVARWRIAKQWTVILVPTLDFVSVRARTRYLGPGLCDHVKLNPGARIDEALFVNYPKDPAGIVGEEYTAKLRAAVEKAVTAVEEDYAAAQMLRGEASR